MKIDPVSLKLFLHVVEEGSIASAAIKSHISASAVSKRISDLEGVLTTRLLARTNKGVVATPAGVELTNMARGVLHEMDEIYVQMRDYSNGVRGHVRVTANLSAITQFLPVTIKQFLVMHPQVQIQLQENISAVVTKAVIENIADIGIFTASANDHRLQVFPYHSDELVLIAPEDHPLASHSAISFEETLDFDYVGLHSGSALNLQLTKVATELDRTMKMAIRVTSFDAVCMMVNAGLGIAILPRTVAQPYLSTHAICVLSIKDPWATRELKICVRSIKALPVAAQMLVRHLTHLCHF